ncbi:MAG: FAD-binding protein, partial [Chloroflexi bacterium]|nr:FAD-binding protein [Chloroflexota bacterium]
FYPPDPSSVRVATLGGTVAEGAGGLSGAKYGTTKDYVLGLEVVLPTGEIIRTGGKTVKDRAGFDLTHLIVGSEGTLGIITEMTLRLIPLPEARQTCIAAFDSVEQAAETVMAIVRRGIVPMALELMDKESVHHAEAFRPAGLPLDAGAILLIEVDGSEVDVPHQLQRVLDACKEEGAREVRVAANDRERELMWSARRAHYPALAQAAKTIIVEDVTVPRPVLAKAIRAIREAAERHHVRIGLAAHAGDGNIHPDIMCDESDSEEMERVHRFFQDIMRAAIDLGGSISGEHGIGLLKKEFLPWQRGEAGVEAMRRIKRALDPNNILNPDKVF